MRRLLEGLLSSMIFNPQAYTSKVRFYEGGEGGEAELSAGVG